MDRRIGAGIGLLLGMEVINGFQTVLPPLYGSDTYDSEDVRRAAKFVAVYILIIAFLAGALTRSPWPLIVPAVALFLIYYFYLYETGSRIETAIVPGEEDEF